VCWTVFRCRRPWGIRRFPASRPGACGRPDLAVGVLKRGGKFYGTDRERWWGVGMREIYRLRQAIEEIFRGLQQELGWTGHRHWRRARLLAHLALGLVAYGLIERQREGLGLSFYQCRRRLIAGKLSLDLSPLLPVQVETA
jgi:putative transposase